MKPCVMHSANRAAQRRERRFLDNLCEVGLRTTSENANKPRSGLSMANPFCPLAVGTIRGHQRAGFVAAYGQFFMATDTRPRFSWSRTGT
jgi:hypothetical protein